MSGLTEANGTPADETDLPGPPAAEQRPLAEPGAPRAPVAPPYSYGSRDVQPGYESHGYSAPEPWGRDPWTDDD